MSITPTSPPPRPAPRSEDILSEKTDVCISNAIVKTGISFGAGVVLSAVFFRRRAFPVWLGTGAGLGAAYSDCQRVFNPVAIPGYRIVGSEGSAAAPVVKEGKVLRGCCERIDMLGSGAAVLRAQGK